MCLSIDPRGDRHRPNIESPVALLVVIALAIGTVNAFDMPIRQSFAVEMVGREDIGNAVALNSAMFNGARIVGPAVAGLTIGAVGVAAGVRHRCGELPRGHRRAARDARDGAAFAAADRPAALGPRGRDAARRGPGLRPRDPGRAGGGADRRARLDVRRSTSA